MERCFLEGTKVLSSSCLSFCVPGRGGSLLFDDLPPASSGDTGKELCQLTTPLLTCPSAKSTAVLCCVWRMAH